jgi:hypothetical protein
MGYLIVATLSMAQDSGLITAGKMLNRVKDENVLWEQ